MKAQIHLSDKFSYAKLLRFILPSIIMMIFTSIYGVVDGLFVSNFVGKTQFAGLNFIMPFLMLLGAFGFMFGAGGNALVSKLLGEGNREKANKIFSMLVVITLLLGATLTVLGWIFIDDFAFLLGAREELLEYSVQYGRIILISLPFFMLQLEFQNFFSTAEKPKLGLAITIGSGVTNMVLDALFIVVFKWGLVGAAIATMCSEIIGGGVPLIYFASKNKSLLRLVKTRFFGKEFIKTCTNGSSELLTNVSMSLINMVYNIQLLNLAGENGVAAYGFILYVNFVFISAYIGYSVGSAPITGYNYGAKNTIELKNVLKKSLVIIASFSLTVFVLSILLSKPLAMLFVGYDKNLYDLTVYGFRIFSFSFLLSGFAIYGSSFFTSLNNGVISAIISFFRTCVFQLLAVILLPLVLGVDGIWLSIVVAEFLAVTLNAVFLVKNKKRYGY